MERERLRDLESVMKWGMPIAREKVTPKCSEKESPSSHSAQG